MSEPPPRDDVGTTSPTERACPICGAPFIRVRRQAYCSSRCRRTAWRRRHAATGPPPPPPAGRSRREGTVYRCEECDTRYLGEQWCHDCRRPCRRIGPGAPCPHCDEPVAFADLDPRAGQP